MSDADSILLKLKEVRRRQFLVLFLGQASIALLGWLFWAFLCKLEFFAGYKPSLMVWLTPGVVLVSAACARVFFRKPTWKDSAKLVDQALGLNQRVETSFECIPALDEMDALLLKDTIHRIASVPPAAIVPMQFDRGVRVSLCVCVMAIAAMGILRILQRWDDGHNGKTGNAIQIAAGSLPQSKTPLKTMPTRRPANNSDQSQSLTAYNSDSEPNRRLPRDMKGVSDRANPFQSQSMQGTPVTSTPDKSIADTRKEAAATFLRSPARSNADRSAENHPADKPGNTSAGNLAPPRGGSAGDNSFHRPDAAAASIRRAEKSPGGQPGAAAFAEAPAKAGAQQPAGQSGLVSLKSTQTKTEAADQVEYSWDYPALRSAAERALAKEQIPPGLKRYIADYFKAIHP
jgi:hypothetical protein